MRRLAVISIFLLLCPSLWGQNTRINLYRVSMDSVVRMMESRGYGEIYFVEDAAKPPRFTFECTEGDFLKVARGEILRAGYSISKYGEDTFILKGAGISTSLPYHYFGKKGSLAESKGENQYVEALSQDGQVASFQNKVYEIGRKDRVSSETIYLSGIVKNVKSGEPIMGVSVYNEETKAYASTDEYGFYKIELPAGMHKVKLSGFSLEDVSLNVEIYESGDLDVMMSEKVLSLKGAVVSAETVDNRKSNKMGVELIRIGRVKQVPSVFGEADVMKIVLTLPGVKSVGEASNGFNVRGGAVDQNLILFNDGTIYNPSHLFGLFSAFNPDVVSDLELYKSSIPANYGGRISSVLEIRGREGSSKKVTGSAGIGLLTTHAHLEGPLSPTTTFIVGGRTTYSNWILNLLPEESSYSDGKANFYDVNGSVTQKIGKNNTLSASVYYSGDGFDFGEGQDNHKYNNLNASLRWRSVFDDRHQMTASAGYDQYGYRSISDGDIELTPEEDPFSSIMNFSINQGFLKVNFQSILSSKHKLSYGLNTIFYSLNPGSFLPTAAGESYIVPSYLGQEYGVEAALFVSDTWNVTDKFSTDLGIRYSSFFAINPFKYYGGPEFRVSGKYLIDDIFTVKAGFNSMRQYIHLLSNTSTVSPTDTWKLSDADIKPQSGWQAAAALYANLMDNQVEASVEGYYKRMSNYLDYADGAVLTMNPNIAEDVVPVYGKAWGLEFMMKKPLGKLNGWVSYTYSRTHLKEMEDRGIQSINRGEWYPAIYDKPHDIKLVGNYMFTHRFSVSVNLDYSTGRPITVPVAKYYYAGDWRLEYSDRNTYRIPDYFRLDAAVNIEPGHYLKKLTHFSITLGVYNVTGRKNAYSVFFDTSGDQIIGKKLTIYGCPIPYINVNMKF